jgi:outer membrane biosynthesis protein TonB
MKKALFLLVLAACGPQSSVASPTPVFPPDAGVDPNAPDAAADNPGELTMAEVQAQMGPIRDTVTACAQATTFEGKVTVQVTIYPDGRASAELIDAANDKTVDDCVTGAFAEATFPTSQRGQRFKYSFTF